MVFILVVFPQVKNSYTKQLALHAFFQEKCIKPESGKKKIWCIYLFINNLKFINNFYFLFWPQEDRTS